MTRARLVIGGAALASMLVTTRARATETKVCLESSQKGQEARDSGKLLDARRHLAACADPSCPQPVPTYCSDWLKDVNRRIPTLVFRVTDAAGQDLVDVTTTIDDVVVGATLDGRPVEVDPGRHRVTFEHGSARAEQTVLVVDSEKARVITAKLELSTKAVAVAPTAHAPPVDAGAHETYRPVPTTSWVAWGVGAASLVGFGIFGLKAQSKFDDFKATCGSRCTTEDRDSVKSTILVADVLLGVGIVAAGVGTYFFLTRPARERPTSTARAGLTPNGFLW